jgi:hypothetical protein
MGLTRRELVKLITITPGMIATIKIEDTSRAETPLEDRAGTNAGLEALEGKLEHVVKGGERRRQKHRRIELPDARG